MKAEREIERHDEFTVWSVTGHDEPCQYYLQLPSENRLYVLKSATYATVSDGGMTIVVMTDDGVTHKFKHNNRSRDLLVKYGGAELIYGRHMATIRIAIGNAVQREIDEDD